MSNYIPVFNMDVIPTIRFVTEMGTYTTGQKFGIFGKYNRNSRIWHFDLLQMAWHQPQMDMVTLI